MNRIHNTILLYKNANTLLPTTCIFTSDAPELSSARIQLELEDFQLGSAREILGSAHIAKNLTQQAICTI